MQKFSLKERAIPEIGRKKRKILALRGKDTPELRF